MLCNWIEIMETNERKELYIFLWLQKFYIFADKDVRSDINFNTNTIYSYFIIYSIVFFISWWFHYFNFLFIFIYFCVSFVYICMNFSLSDTLCNLCEMNSWWFQLEAFLLFTQRTVKYNTLITNHPVSSQWDRDQLLSRSAMLTRIQSGESSIISFLLLLLWVSIKYFLKNSFFLTSFYFFLSVY